MTLQTSWRVIQLSDVVPTAWRNGGGTTRELVAWPSAQAWRWRVSVAEVAKSGPFSSFAGVQRWFAVLEGDGVCLTVDGSMHMLVEADAPFAFDGAATTTCELLGGATQDFNLMMLGGCGGRMLRVDDHFEMTTKTPKTIAVYANNRCATVQYGHKTHELSAHSFGWVQLDANTAVHVRASDALLMEMDA